jgi:DNA-binding NarL/FixJ family response regulator
MSMEDLEYVSRLLRSNPGAGEDTEPIVERIWRGLMSGESHIVAHGVATDRHYLQVAPRRNANPTIRVTPRKLCRLVRMLLGESQKQLAFDGPAALSTIAAQVSDCLQQLGLSRRSHRLPFLLVVLAHITQRGLCPSLVRVTPIDQGSNPAGWWVECSRAELQLARTLSEGETFVVAQLVAGATHVEIANLRKTRVRTVANQLANAYAKLRISGRAELLARSLPYLEPLAEPASARSAIPFVASVARLERRPLLVEPFRSDSAGNAGALAVAL